MRRECQCEHSARNIHYEDSTELFKDHQEMTRNVQNAIALLAQGAGEEGAGIYDAGMQDKTEEHQGEIFNIYEGEEVNSAIGENSHAEGKNTIAMGENSHAEGNHTIAKRNDSHASGTYNSPTSLDSQEDYLFTIGNGVSEQYRSNALSVKYNGDTEISGKYKDNSGEILVPVVPINTSDPDFIEQYGSIEGFEESSDYKRNVFYAYYSIEYIPPIILPEPGHYFSRTQYSFIDFDEDNLVTDDDIEELSRLVNLGIASADDEAFMNIVYDGPRNQEQWDALMQEYYLNSGDTYQIKFSINNGQETTWDEQTGTVPVNYEDEIRIWCEVNPTREFRLIYTTDPSDDLLIPVHYHSSSDHPESRTLTVLSQSEMSQGEYVDEFSIIITTGNPWYGEEQGRINFKVNTGE